MATLPNTGPTIESLIEPLALLDPGLVVASVAVAGFAFRDGDVVTAPGMGLLFASDVLTTGISLSGKSVQPDEPRWGGPVADPDVPPYFIMSWRNPPRMKCVIEADEAPVAAGAYSQTTTNGSLLYTAGQTPLTPDGELLDDKDIVTQMMQLLDNVMAILAEAGVDTTDVLKTTVFLVDIDDFDEMDETYVTYFDEEPPARSAVEVGNLPKGVGVGIEAVAVVDEE